MYKNSTMNDILKADLSEYDDLELEEELEYRGLEIIGGSRGLLGEIYQKRRLGKEYDHLVDRLIHLALGKVI